jgi:hypothetical protein
MGIAAPWPAAEVRRYKSAFAAGLRKLPARLRTASAKPQLPGQAVRAPQQRHLSS